MSKYVPLRFKKVAISFLIDKRAAFITMILALLTLGLFTVSTGMGEMKITPINVLKVLFGYGSEMETIVVYKFRLPRIIIATLAGAALAVAGAILQGIVRNPLTSPDLTGITGGGVAAVATFLVFFSDPRANSLTVSLHWQPVAAFLGAMLVALFLYFLAWKNGVTPMRLVLIGVGLHAAMQAITTTMLIFGPLYLITEVTIWLTGSVYAATWEDVWVLFLWMCLILPTVFILARNLNVQELGDEIATGVGSAVQTQRMILLLLSAALVAGAVAFAGGISFVGLLAPHIARKLVGSAFGALLPASAFIGSLMLLVADLIGRTAFSPLDIPAGVFTACIGAPYFIYLLYKNRNA